MQRSVGIVELLLFSALALMWGSAFLLIKLALGSFLPIDIVFWRLLSAAVVLGILCIRSRRHLPRQPKVWGMIAALGAVANSLPFFLVSWSETLVDSSFAALVIASVPLWTAALIPLFVPEEHMTRQRLTGIGIGFLGVILLTGGLSGTDLTAHLLPKLCLLAAALSYAIGVILIRRLHAVPAEVTSFGMNLTAWLAIAPAALISGAPFSHVPSLSAGAAVAALGLFSSATASMVLVILIQRVGAARASVTNYLVPMVAALLGVMFLEEELAPELLIGLSLILLGVWISSRREKVPATT
jgi:drug/metabolite transporter (DMT)-like permease